MDQATLRDTQENSLMGEFLTVSETATYLRLSRAQLYRLINRKQIPHVRIGDKRIVINRDQLQKWLLDNTIVPSIHHTSI